jgi:hypothetical protein
LATLSRNIGWWSAVSTKEELKMVDMFCFIKKINQAL